MRFAVGLVFASILLAGCSSGNGLSGFVVTRADVGSDFVYTAFSEEVREEGINGNPGSLDVDELFDPEDGVVAGYLASFSRANDTETPLIQSAALRFRNATLALEWTMGIDGCGGDGWAFIKGETLMVVQPLTFFAEEDDRAAVIAAAERGALALQARTGASDICAA